MIYETEDQIHTMLGKFENATIADSEWRHEEHLVAACVYLSRHDFETALGKMRGGIKNLLRAFGADPAKYHETLTVAWMRIVESEVRKNDGSDIVRICASLCTTLDRDVPFRHYSRDLLLSDRARQRFVEPDIAPFSGDYL